MKIVVQGLWHLGSVISACMSSLGHDVIAYDDDKELLKKLNLSIPPVSEPGLDEMIDSGLKNKKLKFVDNIISLPKDLDLFWITYDTPVDNNDNADVKYVIEKIKNSINFLPHQVILLISSQLPVGSLDILKEYTNKMASKKMIHFGVTPENLRLGKGIESFLNPERIVIGVENDFTKKKLNTLFSPITKKLIWMKPASAEMVKHAVNSFLAMSISFTNEISLITEANGGNSKEVELALRSEPRIGQKAYVSPGSSFSGGTLARDINFLIKNYKKKYPNDSLFLLNSILKSNNKHKNWLLKSLKKNFRNLNDVRIAFWGITYTSNTDTLRRSLMVELINILLKDNAKILIFDPLVKKSSLPKNWFDKILFYDSPQKAAYDADCLVIGPGWDSLEKDYIILQKGLPEGYDVFDANWLVSNSINKDKVNYHAVGFPKNE